MDLLCFWQTLTQCVHPWFRNQVSNNSQKFQIKSCKILRLTKYETLISYKMVSELWVIITLRYRHQFFLFFLRPLNSSDKYRYSRDIYRTTTYLLFYPILFSDIIGEQNWATAVWVRKWTAALFFTSTIRGENKRVRCYWLMCLRGCFIQIILHHSVPFEQALSGWTPLSIFCRRSFNVSFTFHYELRVKNNFTERSKFLENLLTSRNTFQFII